MSNTNGVVKDLICLRKISRPTEEMVRMLLGLFGRFVFFEEKVFYFVAIIYVILTHFYDVFDQIPYLQILGQYGSGKSRTGDVFEKLCSNSLNTGDISDAALFRAINEKKGPTAIVDEADDLSGGTRRGILLRVLKTGYRRNGSVTRCGQGGRLERFSTFGPKIILNEKGISDRALASRCIAVHMMRSPRPLERLILLDDGDEFKQARERIRTFCDDFRDVVLDRYDSFQGIDGISGRDEEVWAPMIIIAELLAALLDSPLIKEEIIRLARRAILQREKTEIIGNTPAQILESTQAYIEDPPTPPIEIDGLRFYVGESLCKFIKDGWSIPMKLDTVSRVLNHYGIVREVRRPHLKMKIKGSEVDVQRSCYALDEERLLKLAGQHGKGGKNS
jgi:hypothetical protein